MSLTFSPLHLILPVFEATAEVRPVDHLGIAAIGGYGSVSTNDIFGNSFRFQAYEVGGHVIGYPLPGHSFDSLEVGAELLYARVVTNRNDIAVSGSADGLAVGPFVGYKLITGVGFTFVAQGGFEYVGMRSHASANGSSASLHQSEFIPLLNLNVGWSF